MDAQAVIDAYVEDVVRRLPVKQREGLALELRGLLSEMLDDRAAAAGRAADDALVLDMLRGFGAPAEVAARYRAPGAVIVPPEQTRAFAWTAMVGVALQWALSLPAVFDGQPLAQWWFGHGLGALWWPGLMVTFSLVGMGLRGRRWLAPAWKPRLVDPDRVHRGWLAFGLSWYAVAVLAMACLPMLVGQLPAPVARALAFDPQFLHQRAWLALPLWLADLATRAWVLREGRWTRALRRGDVATSLAFIALLLWWIWAGPMFLNQDADATAKAAIALVALLIAVDLAVKWHRGRGRAPRGLPAR
jgi:hypothetical protein